MKIIPPLLTVMLSVACVMTSCQSPKAARAPLVDGPPQPVRNNCYSLLHQLLADEKNVDLLLFIKREQDDVQRLIEKIAANASAGAKLLEEFARHDPTIRLDEIRLPTGEAATRKAIAATKKKELLSQTGAAFELSLLLTQAQALSYAWHLAKVAAENEPQPARARALAGLSEDMEKLYHEVIGLMRSRTK